jgi:protein-disulfide isomerase
MRVFLCLLGLSLSLFSGCRRDQTLLLGYVSSVPGYNLESLEQPLRDMFLKIVNAELCPCGHPHMVAKCIASNANCEDSHRLARYALRKISAGETLSRVILIIDRYFQQGEKPAELPVDGAPTRGSPNAPVTIVEFSDFECPFCKRALPVLDEVLKKFDGKVKLVFKHYPLVQHKNAMQGAIAAVAAMNQGKFWEMHDLLFQNQQNLSREGILELGKKLGLDMQRFERNLDDPSLRAYVKADMDLARKASVHATPSFFINGHLLHGSKRFENYRDYIELALDGVRPLAKK